MSYKVWRKTLIGLWDCLLQVLMIDSQRLMNSWYCRNSTAPRLLWPTWTDSHLDTHFGQCVPEGCSGYGHRESIIAVAQQLRSHIHPLKLLQCSSAACSSLQQSGVLTHFLFCVSELFILLHTRNPKSCSMGFSFPIAERCTCPLPGLQVSIRHVVHKSNGLQLWHTVSGLADVLCFYEVMHIVVLLLQCKTEHACFVHYLQPSWQTLWWILSGWSRPGCSWRESVYTFI